MSEMEDALEGLREELDAMPEAKRPAAMKEALDIMLSEPGFRQISLIVDKLKEFADTKDAKLVPAVHAIAEGIGRQMDAEGFADFAALKKSELSKPADIAAFAAKYGVDANQNETFKAYREGVTRMMDMVEAVSNIPDDKYDDADTVATAVKSAFPAAPKGNPLRRGAKPATP